LEPVAARGVGAAELVLVHARGARVKKVATIGAVIEKLERIRDRVSQPQLFYRKVQLEWTQLARRVVEQTLVALQPPDIEPVEWLAKVTEISARVVAIFVNDEGPSRTSSSGLSFSIQPRIGTEEPDTVAGFTLGNLSIQDIERWVRAGREKTSPDEPGKELDERDVGKSDLQIAWRVMYALKLRKPGWERLMAVLRDFVGLQAEEAAEAIYPVLLSSWLEHFAVRAPSDWREYVRELVRGS
jgi:hypothetical protein